MSLHRFLKNAVRLLVICAVLTTLTPPAHAAYASVNSQAGSPGTANAALLTDGQDSEPPSSPEALTTVAYPGYILVDWYGASDDTGIIGYMVYRDGLPLAQVDGGTLSYRDNTVQAGVYYTYRVETIDTVGNHSAPATTEPVSATRIVQLFIPLVSSGETSLMAPPETAGVAAVGYSSKLRRYPYLTDVVSDFATINWATDVSGATGYVTWGKVGSESCTAHSTPAVKKSFSVSSTVEYQWAAQLTLTADSQYCYRVYLESNPTVDLLGTDPSPIFWTQVPKGLNKPFSFAVLGDWGDVDNAGAPQAKLMQLIAASGARFAFTAGDNAYPSANQTNYGDLVQTGTGVSGVFGPQFWAVPGRSIALFPAQGNHGYSISDANHPQLLNFPQTRAVQLSNGRYQRDTYSGIDGTTSKNYPSTWYAFDVGLARFYVLDAVWADTNLGTAGSPYQVDYDYHWAPGRPEYQWLVNDLAAHPTALKFAFFHYPLYSDNKAENSDTYLHGIGTSKLEGLLIDNGVKLVFNGHAHIYQRNVANGLTSYVLGATGTKLAPLDGGCSSTDAYGLGYSNSKRKVFTCGAATTNPPTDTTGIYNFVLVEVNGLTVTVKPTDQMGRIFDQQTFSFTSTVEIAAPTAPQYITATATSPTQVNLIWSASTDNIGVTGYDIYRNGVVLTSVGAITAYADTTVTKTTTYQYQLRARDAAGNLSLLSSTAGVTTPGSDATPPTAPSFVTATATIATEVSLKWTASTDDIGVTEYVLYRNGITLTSVGAVTAYTDTAVNPATTYQYQLTARDAAGNVSVLSSPVTVTTPAIADITPPTTPNTITATATGATRIDLAWTAAADDIGVTGYDIYRDNVLFTTVGAVTTYTDMTVNTMTTYQYQVLARDASGKTSALSSPVTVTTPALTAVVFKDGFESGDLLSWTISNGLTVQTTLTHTGDYAAQANTTVGNTYAKKTLPSTYSDGYGRIYFNLVSYANQVNLLRFRTATDASQVYLFVSATGKLGMRNDINGTTLTSATTVTSGWHSLELHATINGASSMTEVWLDDVKITNLSITTDLGTLPIGRFQIGDVQAARTYNVVLDDVVFDSHRIGSDATPPSAPSLVTATAVSPTQVILTWTIATDDIGVTSYDIYRNATLLATVGAVTVYSDTTAAQVTNYQYQLRSRDAAGNVSVLSTPVTVTTPAIPDITPPTSPNAVTATATSATQIILAWAASTDDIGVTGYDIYRDNTLLITLGTDTTYTDTAVNPSTTYQYQLLAHDAAGNISSLSNAASVTTPEALDSTPPSTPSVVTATASGATSVVLTWATAADDVGVTGYDIYRDNTLLTSVEAVTAFTDTTVSPVTTYQYQLLARDAAGNVSVLSSPVTVTTPAIPDITPPTTPNTMTATATGATRIDLAWTAAADDIGVTGYDIYRDNVLFTTVGAVTSYTDMTVNTMTTYQYQVLARDASGKTSALSSPVTVTTPALTAAVFQDGFESGDLLSWTISNGLTVQTTLTHTGDYAAQANTTVGNTYAKKTLPSTYSDGYGRIYFNLVSYANQVNLLRFRTATDASQVYLFVSAAGKLGLRNDINLTTLTSATTVTSGWHALELHATINGASSTTEVWLDDVKITNLSITTDLGTLPIGRFQIGDVQAARTYNVVLDDVVFDSHRIGSDTTPPSAPSLVTATAVGPTQVVLTWTIATDDIGVTSYDIYRNGIPLTTVGAVTTYADATVTQTTNYQYQLRSRDAAGNASLLSSVAGVTTPAIADITPPTSPSVVTATASSAFQADMTWTAATDDTGVTGYDIYRDNSLLTSVGAVTEYTDTTVSPVTTYQYQILARDAAGNVSMLSSPVTVTTPAAPDTTPPSTPSITTAVASSPTQVDMAWSVATDDTGVTGYDIYRDNSLLTTVGTVTAYTDTTVSPATTYQYQLTARDAAGNVSVLSNPVTVTTPAIPDITPPTTPSVVTATATSATQIKLIWAASTDNIGVTSYDIYRDNALLITLGTDTTYTDTAVSPLTTYQYQVLARDIAGNVSSLSSAASVTTPAALDSTPPSTPSAVTATASGATSVVLTWATAIDDVGVTGYDIYRDSTLLTTVEAVTVYTDTTVNPETTYQYQLLARDAAGNVSVLSSIASVTTPAVVPPVFTDGFESGDLSAWTTKGGFTVQSTFVHTANFAVQANTTVGATYAKKLLPSTYSDGYGRIYFNLLSYSSQVNLLRFRTGVDVSLTYLFVTNSGKLALRNDVGASTLTSATGVGSGWHALELHATINGASSTTEVWLDGVKVTDLSVTTNLGTTPIGKMQIGEVQGGRTYNLILDDVVFDIKQIGLTH